MCNQRWSNDAEIEIDNEDVYVCREFSIDYGLTSRAKDRCYDDNPNHNDDDLENERRKGPFKMSILCNPPKLEMPAVNQRPEDERRTHCSK